MLGGFLICLLVVLLIALVYCCYELYRLKMIDYDE